MDARETQEEIAIDLLNDPSDLATTLTSVSEVPLQLDPQALSGAIETVIFMSDRPLPLVKIRNMIEPERALVDFHEAIVRLQSEYEASHHGIRLLEVAEGYQFRTKIKYSKYVQRIFKSSSLVLTPTALEVLAIVAYKQPISRADIDKIRGVDSSHLLRSLLDKRLVRVLKRADDLGKMVLYGTTADFLEMFELRSLEDLPPEYELEAFAANSQVGKVTDIRTMIRGEIDQMMVNDLSELDRLKEEIGLISADTEFTRQLRSNQQRKSGGGEEMGAEAMPASDGTSTPTPAPALVKEKSAFELLEEFVTRQEVREQNLLASQSIGPEEILNLFFPVELPTPEPLPSPSVVIEEYVEVAPEELPEESVEELMPELAMDSDEVIVESAISEEEMAAPEPHRWYDEDFTDEEPVYKRSLLPDVLESESEEEFFEDDDSMQDVPLSPFKQ